MKKPPYTTSTYGGVGGRGREAPPTRFLTRLNHGNINDAIARFAEEFTFKDRVIGLEFKDKGRLAEFFQKTREYFPDSSLQADSILVSFDHVVSEWTLHTSDYYDGLTSRRPALAAHFTDWGEL